MQPWLAHATYFCHKMSVHVQSRVSDSSDESLVIVCKLIREGILLDEPDVRSEINVAWKNIYK